jgi:cell division protein FtsI/penicillin-binding protein 2
MPEERVEKTVSPNTRTNILIGIMCVFGVILVIKLFYVQILKHNFYLDKANAQQSRKFNIAAKRGEIFVQDGNNELYPIALNQQVFLLAADPKYINNRGETFDKLSKYIPEDKKDDIQNKLEDKDNRYVVINKKLGSNDANGIKAMKLPGIIISEQQGRNYPEGELFAHITGYVNGDEVGQYGVEQFKNQDLSGIEGVSRAVTDSLGVPITSNENTIVQPKDGNNIVLTVDRNLQAAAAIALEKAVKDNKAESGSVVIMDPKTGAIRAMVNYPTYDPNNFQSVTDYNRFTNASVSSVYEPGSGFKAITMAAGLDTGKVKPDTKYDDTGEVQIDDKTIKNADNHKFGISTMTDVIQKSLNTGVVFVLKQLGTDQNNITSQGKKIFYEYIKKFGFGEKTGIEISGESRGVVKDDKSYDVDYANMTFGQGISVTDVQMVSAFAAIANGGTLYKPYIIDREISQNGEVTKNKPSVVRNDVISTQSAASLATMLEQVVLKGSGRPSRMVGYNIAGKTGTAQVPKENGLGYEESKNIGSFVGFAPVEDPKFVMLVRVNYPKVDGFAEKTAVPAFGEIARQLMMYYQIPPSGN